MASVQNDATSLLSDQRRVRDRCFHPTAPFIEFGKEEVEQSIPARFEQQVARYPNRLAVKSQEDEFTYLHLDQLANRLAQAILAQRGGAPEPIALLLDNNAAMIAGMLGVLKAGKIYVPLDATLPPARLAYILEDSQTSLLVTDTHNLPLARQLQQDALSVLNLDAVKATSASDSPHLAISADAQAWILYTSGSTGEPKGVIQNHRNVLRYTMDYTNGLHISAEDRVCPLFSFSANIASHYIFMTLLNGSALYLFNIPREGVTPLAKWLTEQAITIYCSVPTVFRHFVWTLADEARFPDLRLVKLVGETMTRQEVSLFRRHFTDGCILINRLGCTETGTMGWFFIDKQTRITDDSVPIGYAVENTEILILDDSGTVVGANAMGEITVKSRYLSPGYWQKPEQTRGAFQVDPADGNTRIYATGDLGRLLPDGCLFHLGRKDFQVKIRGHRVEIAAVEMALRNVSGLKDAAVMARQDGDDESHLVAYVVSHMAQPPTVTALREALADDLPSYMIPSTFVVMDRLPLAPNGKVDRRALPTPGHKRPELETAYTTPRTPTETLLADIWAEVLGLDHVGIHDPFLDLGGHSLLASQIVARVYDRFQVELSPGALLGAATVAAMAEVILPRQGPS